MLWEEIRLVSNIHLLPSAVELPQPLLAMP